MLTIAKAGLIGAGANLIGNSVTNALNVIEAEKTRNFNAEQAKLNREFQEKMAKNNIKYAVDQAKELGISPSLILGDQTNALGGSQASASGGQANITNTGITSATNGILNVINEQNKLKAMEEMNEDRLQTLKEIQNMKMGNSTNNNANEYIKRNGYNSKEEFYKSVFTDIDKIKI